MSSVLASQKIHRQNVDSQRSSAYEHQYFIEVIGPRALRERYDKVEFYKKICMIIIRTSNL